jgi:hypothetical protein
VARRSADVQPRDDARDPQRPFTDGHRAAPVPAV